MLSFLLRCAAFLELAAVVAFFQVTSLLEDDDEGWVSLNTPTIYKQTQSFLMVYGIFANKKKSPKSRKAERYVPNIPKSCQRFCRQGTVLSCLHQEFSLVSVRN